MVRELVPAWVMVHWHKAWVYSPHCVFNAPRFSLCMCVAGFCAYPRGFVQVKYHLDTLIRKKKIEKKKGKKERKGKKGIV